MRSTPSSADRRSSLRTAVTAGLLIALGSVLGYVESVLVPALPVPGVRLGLANVVVVLALAVLGARGAFVVTLGRVVVTAALVGSLGGPATLLATTGALASWAIMVGLARAGGRFSVIGWSVAGAAAHVAGQLAVASVMVGTGAPLLFAPVSLALALGCGLAVGCCSRLLLSRIPVAVGMEVAR